MLYICSNDIGDPYLVTFLGLCLICNNMILVPCNAWLVILLMYEYFCCCLVLLHGLSPQVNYTDRATATCQRSSCIYLYLECVGFKTIVF
jgi:hypothetical protein